MKVLVVGGWGMLGSDLVAHLRSAGHDVMAPPRSVLDIASPESVAEVALGKYAAEWCINCAAYTAVDKAEIEPDIANEINGLAPGYLARACAMSGSRLLHVSTDFVFDGSSDAPYDEEAPTHPLGAYARSKLAGEHAVLASLSTAVIVRTAWLYGPNGSSFPRTMIRAWEAGKTLRVVDDQVGCPTYTADLARTLGDLIALDPAPGIYHAVGPESMTWRRFAELTLAAWRTVRGDGREVNIVSIATEDYPTPAKRPKSSVLSVAKLQGLGVAPMRPVAVSLAEFCQRVGNSQEPV
ncbi:MAG: dTDP-4-dehydrorhamnose reductase [Fimbriimonas ginsengisoli]|uniref:dTDP-4-dehydrorhamnose reductase n=1 Tax=Fimbriimonas ginsengisoli TaxID=1005039 RepID=A0A931PTH7_FIMGI|nr:dTDP-4-dehydrorhamnose reductase [Fimbriimonas ginsengisoli]